MVDASLGLPGSFWREQALILNAQPARYLHDSWFDTLPFGKVARRLRAVPRARPALSRHLLAVFGLEGHYVVDFANPWARLALLEGAHLERLLRRLGLALRTPVLRRELSGVSVRALKSALPEEDWTFMTRTVPLLGRIPDFHSKPRRDELDPATECVLIGARFCALQGLAVLDRALVGRLALKLPLVCASALHTGPAPDSTVLPRLLRKLLRELPDPWPPLFV